MGISGRMFSSACIMSDKTVTIGMQHTQYEVSHCIVVGQRPWQATLGEDLDAANGKCVDVNLLGELALACHELRGLPT